VSRPILLALLSAVLLSWGCTKVQPIMTPQEYDASCRADAAGADPACAARVCAVYQAVVTDYYEDKEGCRAACKARANELKESSAAQCAAKIDAAENVCLDFCQRKFFRCNCGK
jgi:hypothetical protein